MGLDFLEKCQPIRVRGEIIARIFNDAQQLGLQAQGTRNSPTTTVGAALKNPKAFNAINTYICTTAKPNVTFPSNNLGLRGSGSVWNNANSPRFYEQSSRTISPTAITDANRYNNIVGLLTPVKVSDFMTQKNFTTITRLYAATTEGGGINYQTIVDTTTKKCVDETTLFGDYVVPVIEWFYTDNNGERQKLNDVLFLYYFFTTTAFEAIEHKQRSLFGGTYHTYTPITVPITGDGIGYFTFSPPYRHTSTLKIPQTVVSDGFLGSGVVYNHFPDGSVSSRDTYIARHSAPYVLLIPDTRTISSDNYILPLYSVDVDGISSPVGLGVAYTGYGGDERFPAYKDIQSVIDLFADYGMTVTTDLDTALNPPETDDGKINPSNPSEELPFYPDNSTEKTPIEPAYITPSTFAQARVYNPLTTRDFLTWICDNTVDISNWARLFANPVDVITGINIFNLDIVAHDSAHTVYNSATNILGVQTNIPNYSIIDGYNNIIDGGTLRLPAYYGNYADFTSMTYQMFIPFVGFTTLRACDVVNRTLHLYYAVDFSTGSAVAFVNSDEQLIYSSPCTVAGKIPLSVSDKNSQMINNTLSIFGGISGLLGGVASGNVGGGIGALFNGLGGLQLQTNYANKGSLSAVNMYRLLPAFIERTRYDLFFPSNDQQYKGAKYQAVSGAPSTQYDVLINCVNNDGFVQAADVRLVAPSATDAEKEQIITLIKSGIYL